MSRDEIKEGFLRQVANLSKYMNAYSFTLRQNCVTEEEFESLYDTLTNILYKEDKK